MQLSKIVEENKLRRSQLEAPYNPIIGEGSRTPRFRFQWDDKSAIYLPDEMQKLPVVQEIMSHGSLQSHAHDKGIPWDDAQQHFSQYRCQFDFEFWSFTAAKIKDKETAEYIDFRLNRPQRDYVAVLERQRVARKPVRVIVLKHRQWGCTTMSFTYIAWHQIELYMNRDAWFIGLDKQGGEDVISRYKVIVDKYPFGDLSLKNFSRSGDARLIPERNCVLNIGTIEKPNAPSGRTPQFAHMFEVGKWPSNPSVNAESVVQNVESMVHDNVGTVCIIESTAKADTGTYFKELCEVAEQGRSAYEFFFVGWLSDETCVRELDVKPGEFVENMNDYDRFLWDNGATLEQICWYKHQQTKPGYLTQSHAIKEEFPTTSQEAFQTGARRVFPQIYIHSLKAACRPPKATGALYADSSEGRDAFKNIVFEPDTGGNLAIWRFPDDPYEDYGNPIDPEVRYINRYIAAVDIGGVWDRADFSDCAVLDRVPMLLGGVPEIVAEWHGHMDIDRFAWVAAQLAYWYNKAELLIEANKYEQNPNNEEIAPDSSMTVLDRLNGVYPNLYMRRQHDTARHSLPSRVGFHMNQLTKTMVIDALMRAVREAHEGNGGYTERNLAACDEMDNFLYQQDGSKIVMAAASRKKDDRVITRSLLAWRHETLFPIRVARNERKRRTPRPEPTFSKF